MSSSCASDSGLSASRTMRKRRGSAAANLRTSSSRRALGSRGRFLGVSTVEVLNLDGDGASLYALRMQAVKAYDAALTALRSDRSGRAVYLQLFDFLRETGRRDVEMPILDVIYRHSDDMQKWSEHG